ncbi:hypothetical protein CROQUDRAFT_36420, partial [Cronartium quercuum f. sp. fusiforme G11]
SLQAFEAYLKEEGIAYKVLQDILKSDTKVFYGLSLELINLADFSKLKNSAHVQGLSPVIKLRQAVPFKHKVSSAPSSSPLSDYSPHIQTNITQLHKMGIFGKGIKIAVIDRAVDCTHPAFGDGFGPGFKLGYGLDYVGDKYDGHNEPKPGPIPCNSCSVSSFLLKYFEVERASFHRKIKQNKKIILKKKDHATHITGIIAGGSASKVGVRFDAAPNATLGIYRMYGCGGVRSEDIMMAEILRAHRDGSDVISISTGYPGGWSEGSPLLDMVNKLVKLKGATIVYSAGNWGDEGLFYPESLASARSVISVGSVDSMGAAVSHLVTSTGQELIYYYECSWNDFNASYPIYITSNSTQVMDHACNPLSSTIPNLKDYVVLIRRGTCWIRTKAKNAQAKGANKILVYMGSGSDLEDVEKDGNFLYGQSRKDPNGFTIRCPPMKPFSVSFPGGEVNSWSEYGPSLDFTSPQPMLCGVGGNILCKFTICVPSIMFLPFSWRKRFCIATILVRLGSYTLRHITVCKSSANLSIQSSTGLIYYFSPVKSHGPTRWWTSKCIMSLLTFALSLNDTSNFNATQTFGISNSGNKSIKYTFSHLPSATVYTYSASDQYSRPMAAVVH